MNDMSITKNSDSDRMRVEEAEFNCFEATVCPLGLLLCSKVRPLLEKMSDQ
jgi:hypothetical protein